MKKVFSILSVMLLFVFAACTKQTVNPETAETQSLMRAGSTSTASATVPSTACGTKTVKFMAGQNIEVGTISVANDKDFVYVTFQTNTPWVMGKTHLYVGTLANMPKTPNGNPKIGNFPYQTTHNPYVNTFTYKVPAAGLPSCFIVAAHAEVLKLGANGGVVQTETGWGSGSQMNPGGSWAMYIDYCKVDCCVYQTVTTPLYGGQTIPAGSISITNDATFLYVTYTTTGGWVLGATHLYVGTLAGLPVNNASTPIPGQFPYKTVHNPYVTSYTYKIPLANLPACYIIATHAELLKIENGTVIQTETGWGYGTPFPKTNRWGWYANYCTQVCVNGGGDDSGQTGAHRK